MTESLLNQIRDVLLNKINEWEEEGLDEDEIEVKIDEWFEDLSILVRQTL